MTGSTILHYRVHERLGGGGMGEVYRAEDTRLGREVALKFIAPVVREDEASRERLLTEARAASLLRSPHVAVTYDIAEHDGHAFIVMEYVEGEVLASRLGRGPLPVPEAVKIAMHVADALDEAHARGIVHRDIKTANLIYSTRGLTKVLDFGLAKFLERRDRNRADAVTRAQVTGSGTITGTVAYMSPEQALGRAVDGRSDLFSLGVVLYEMLTGRPPFEGTTTTEIVDRILHQTPAPVSRWVSQVPPALEAIVQRALEKDPAFRYQTARELYIDLHRLQRELDDVARFGSGAGRTGSAVAPPEAEPALVNAVAVMTFVNITREPVDDWIGTGIAETVTADLKNVPGLSVIGRARVFEVVKNLSSGVLRTLDDQQSVDIGRRLGATWMVGGGYQRMGDRIRITAQFIDVRTGAVLRTVKVDGTVDDIFALQDQIVFELSQGLNLQVGQAAQAAIERAETRSMAAYESYSRGLMNLRLGSRDAIERAIAQLERAIALDPEYAAAWATLGGAYNLKGAFLNLPDLIDRAIEHERRALALDPKLAAAHMWLGSAFVGLGRHDEGIRHIEEAIRLEPANPSAHAWLARAYWIGKGDFDAGIRLLERTTSLNPDAGYAQVQLALLYALRGRYAEGEQAARRAIDLQEQDMSGNEGLQVVGAHARLGYVFYLQGRYEDAIREYERELAFLSTSDHALRERTSIELRQKLGAARLRLGDAADAARHFDLALRAHEHLVAEGADDPATRYYIACLHALRGEADLALDSLGRSSAHLHALNAARAAIDPDLDRLRDEPRFRALLS